MDDVQDITEHEALLIRIDALQDQVNAMAAQIADMHDFTMIVKQIAETSPVARMAGLKL